jgi:hypothetical protein
MSFDEECARNIVDVLSSFGSPFNNRESLVNLCFGIEAPAHITNDLFNAY